MDWIPLRFSKNESFGYYEDLACDFQDKSMRAHVDVSWKTTKKGEVAGDIATKPRFLRIVVTGAFS